MVSTFFTLLLGVLAASAPATHGQPSVVIHGLHQDVVFSYYSPLADSTEVMRRLVSPLTALRIDTKLAHSGEALREQSIDLPQERFAVYVPSTAPPPQGYSLLVFVPPWPEAVVPPGWDLALDHHDMIFVSAANSGNQANVFGRRVPLALLAEQNIVRLYPVNPQHVYVGGYSGGARVAEVLALGYPDVFHGALLEAGSDPIGNAQRPLPPAVLFHRFQETTRLVYMTGSDDNFHLSQDESSRQSMRHWCVFGLDTQTMSFVGHETASGAALDRALDALVVPPKPDPRRLADCRKGIDETLSGQLQKVQNLLANGKSRNAENLLDKIDDRYGGLAAPRSIKLSKEIDARRP